MYQTAKFLSTAAACIVAATVTASASASVIVSYTFSGNSLLPTTTDADIQTATSVVSGNTAGSPDTIVFNTTATYYVTSPSIRITANQTQNGYEEFYSFSVTPVANAYLDMDSFTYTMASDRGLKTKLQVSIGGGSFSDVGGEQSLAGPAKATRVVDLSSLTFAVDQSATFRIFGARTGGNTSTQFYVDDFSLDGTVVVPEPASMALLAMGGLMMLSRRSRITA